MSLHLSTLGTVERERERERERGVYVCVYIKM